MSDVALTSNVLPGTAIPMPTLPLGKRTFVTLAPLRPMVMPLCQLVQASLAATTSNALALLLISQRFASAAPSVSSMVIWSLMAATLNCPGTFVVLTPMFPPLLNKLLEFVTHEVPFQ